MWFSKYFKSKRDVVKKSKTVIRLLLKEENVDLTDEQLNQSVDEVLLWAKKKLKEKPDDNNIKEVPISTKICLKVIHAIYNIFKKQKSKLILQENYLAHESTPTKIPHKILTDITNISPIISSDLCKQKFTPEPPPLVNVETNTSQVSHQVNPTTQTREFSKNGTDAHQYDESRAKVSLTRSFTTSKEFQENALVILPLSSSRTTEDEDLRKLYSEIKLALSLQRWILFPSVECKFKIVVRLLLKEAFKNLTDVQLDRVVEEILILTRELNEKPNDNKICLVNESTPTKTPTKVLTDIINLSPITTTSCLESQVSHLNIISQHKKSPRDIRVKTSKSKVSLNSYYQHLKGPDESTSDLQKSSSSQKTDASLIKSSSKIESLLSSEKSNTYFSFSQDLDRSEDVNDVSRIVSDLVNENFPKMEKTKSRIKLSHVVEKYVKNYRIKNKASQTYVSIDNFAEKKSLLKITPSKLLSEKSDKKTTIFQKPPDKSEIVNLSFKIENFVMNTTAVSVNGSNSEQSEINHVSLL